MRILTLNVWNLEGDPRRQEVLNAELRRLDPDLVSLQEVIQDPERDQLADLLAGTDLQGTHQAEQMAYVPPFADRYGGTAVASRWPYRVIETLDLRVHDAGEVHPWCTLAAVVEVPDEGEMLFIATTSSPYSEAARERQATALTDIDARHRRVLPTVIAGDLNAAPDAASIRYLTGLQSLDGHSVRYHDAWAMAGDGPGYTWASENPNATPPFGVPGHRIDHILIGTPRAHPQAHVRVERAALAFDRPVGGVWPSDHIGVVVDIDVGLDA